MIRPVRLSFSAWRRRASSATSSRVRVRARRDAWSALVTASTSSSAAGAIELSSSPRRANPATRAGTTATHATSAPLRWRRVEALSSTKTAPGQTSIWPIRSTQVRTTSVTRRPETVCNRASDCTRAGSVQHRHHGDERAAEGRHDQIGHRRADVLVERGVEHDTGRGNRTEHSQHDQRREAGQQTHARDETATVAVGLGRRDDGKHTQPIGARKSDLNGGAG